MWRTSRFGAHFSTCVLVAAGLARAHFYFVLPFATRLFACRVVDVEQGQSSTVASLSTDRASVAASIEVVQRSHASLTFAIDALQTELESLAQKQLGQEEVLAEEEAKIEEINRAFAERTQVKLKVQRTASLLDTLHPRVEQ